MDELKRCPFCGAEAEIVRNSSGSYFVRCTNKQCAAKTRLYHENETGARMSWNKRAEPACDREALLAAARELESAYPDSRDVAMTMMEDAAHDIREALADIDSRIRKAVTDDADR